MRKLKVTFPNSGIAVTATLLADKEAELAEILWEKAEKGIDFICHHTMSTGGLMLGHPMPTAEFPLVTPVEGVLLCDTSPGQIFYDGWKTFFVHEQITEPLVCQLGYVAQIDEACLDDYMKACKDVWNHIYLYHTLATVTIGREEK